MPTPANTATRADKLTLTDHDGDTIEFDCDPLMKRLYITAYKTDKPARPICASLDQNATRTIINHLNQWLDFLRSNIAPTTITRS